MKARTMLEGMSLENRLDLKLANAAARCDQWPELEVIEIIGNSFVSNLMRLIQCLCDHDKALSGTRQGQ